MKLILCTLFKVPRSKKILKYTRVNNPWFIRHVRIFEDVLECIRNTFPTLRVCHPILYLDRNYRGTRIIEREDDYRRYILRRNFEEVCKYVNKKRMIVWNSNKRLRIFDNGICVLEIILSEYEIFSKTILRLIINHRRDHFECPICYVEFESDIAIYCSNCSNALCVSCFNRVARCPICEFKITERYYTDILSTFPRTIPIRLLLSTYHSPTITLDHR